MIRIALPLLLFASMPAWAQTTLSTVTQPTVEVPHGIVRVLDAYTEAWERGDSSAFAGLFTGDGMALPNGALPARGTDAIAAAYAQSAGGTLRLRPIAYERSGDLAMVAGAFGAGTGTDEAGKFVLVLRRSADDAWKIVADIDNMNLRPRPAAPSAPPGT